MKSTTTTQTTARIRAGSNISLAWLSVVLHREVWTCLEMDRAPHGEKSKVARRFARRLGIKPQTLWNRRGEFLKRGVVALINRRERGIWLVRRKNNLPEDFCNFLHALSSEARMSRPVAIRFVHDQLVRWRTGDSLAAIPGYNEPPAGDPPVGWAARNLARYLPARPAAAVVIIQLRSDGRTRVLRGKLATITSHPLFRAVSDCVERSKRRRL